MNIIMNCISALLHQDYGLLGRYGAERMIYLLLFFVIFIESGILPAALLPGDTLLIFSGALVSKGILSYFPLLVILTAAAGLGAWFGFWQGRWLGRKQVLTTRFYAIPDKQLERSKALFDRYGLLAFIIGRFIGFARTVLPLFAGLSGLNPRHFHLYSWIGAIIWIGMMTGVGYGIFHLPWLRAYETHIMHFLSLLPVALLAMGLMGAAMLFIKKRCLRT